MNRSRSIELHDPCTCGNTNPREYRLYETRNGEILGKQCIACGKEWFPNKYHQTPSTEDIVDSPASIDHPNKGLFHRLPSEVDDNTACQIIGARTKVGWNLDILIPGNHITWWRKLGLYWHHAIVVEINDCGMYVVHWTKVRGRQIKITKEFLSIDKMLENYDPESLYRLDYPEEIEKANDIDLVLARAFSRVDDTKYGLLSDNCESFATFCKTGCEKSHQVLWLKEKMKEFIGEFGVTTAKSLLNSAGKIASGVTEKALQSATKTVAALVTTSAEKAGKNIAETAIREFTEKLATAAAQVKGKLTEETFKKVWESVVSKASGAVKTAATEITDEAAQEFVAKSAGKVYFAESVEKLSRTSNWVGAGLVVIIEGILMIKDFYKLNKDRISGKLTKRVVIEEATRRSVEGFSAASLAVAFSLGPEAIGMIFGTSVGPVGTLIGGVVGGAVGYAVGKAIGTPAGRCLGRKVSKHFQDDLVVNNINDLDSGDHVILNCSGSRCHICRSSRCHAILIEHDGESRLQIIRNTSNRGVVEEWVDFTKPLHKVIYDEGECKDPQKVILYARLKQHEGYCYSQANYNGKTYAEECKTKAGLL